MSIVTPHAGTTRDVIEVPIDLSGIAAVLLDTAGLRDSRDPAEQEGIRRARDRAANADLVLHIAETMPAEPLGIVVINKIDLGGAVPGGVLAVSAATGDGVTALRVWLADWAAATTRPGEPALLGLARHREAFEEAREALVEALQERDAVLVAEGLRRAVGAFGSVSGRVGVEDLLGHIFSRFCIGK